MNGDVSSALARLGLEPFETAIRSAMRPCVWLTFEAPDEAESHGDRIGGRPSLTAEREWPLAASGLPMTFVLQVDLARLTEFDPAGANLGRIAVFAGAIDGARDLDLRIDSTPAGVPVELRDPPPGVPFANDIFAAIPPHVVRLTPGFDAPGWSSREYDELIAAMPEHLQEAYTYDFCRALEPPGNVIGKLFGCVAGIGSDPRLDAGLADPGEWRPFLRIDSHPKLGGLCIGDAGYLVVMMRTLDLAAGDVSAPYTLLESS